MEVVTRDRLDVPRIPCDGCGEPASPLTLLTDYGHEVRYCAPCLETYKEFVSAVTHEEQRRQRELDLWQLERRTHVPLRLMPMDLPPAASSQRGLVLG